MTPALLDASALRARLNEPGLVLLDARFELGDPDAGGAAWRAACIPGAHFVDLDTVLSDHTKPASEGRHPLPDIGTFRAQLGRFGIGPQSRVVVYDAGSSAMAAARAWWLLRLAGVPQTQVLDGGFAAWRAAGGESAQGVDAQAAEPLDANWPQLPQRVVDAQAVRGRGASATLVDARAPERFRGEVEPLDPRAGHIPGAVSRPFAENLDAGRFKSPERLRDEWQALLNGRAPEDAIVYCGSGVTACHHALALAHAGLAAPRVFAASWSGWTSDPAAAAVAVGA